MGAEPPVLLDLTRSLARAGLPAPGGIDRVERAWARWAIARPGSRFLVRQGVHCRLLDAGGARSLLDLAEGRTALPRPLRRAAAAALVRGRALDAAPVAGLPRLLVRHARGAVHLDAGHLGLDAGVMAAVRAAGLGSVVMLHDAIPLTHPALSGPGAPARFARQLAAAAQADRWLSPSAHSARMLAAQARALGLRPPPACVVAPGLDLPRAAPGPEPGGFLCLATIEPRKGHALLLDIWEAAAAAGRPLPPLHLVGRMGWAGAGLRARLGRRALSQIGVIRHGALPDAAVARLLAGAGALLLPSLAEGFGLPVAEALARGVPVIAADLPALREAGGDAPCFCPPGDRLAWAAAIAAHAPEPATARAARLARLASWRAPGWPAHFAALGNVLETVIAEKRVQEGRPPPARRNPACRPPSAPPPPASASRWSVAPS